MPDFQEKRLELGQKLWVNDATTYFGHSVAIDKDLAIVGDYDGGYYRSDKIGHAYIFSRENNEWRLDRKIKVLDLKAFECFGCAADINDSDKITIVGAYYAQNLSKQTVGAAYVFQLEGEIWQQKQKLQPSDLQLDAGFGSAIAMEGKSAVIGAPQGVRGASKKVGAAYVFQLEGDKWEQTQKLQAPDMGGGDRFGCSVAIDEKAAIVGSKGADAYRKNDTGSAYIFQLENGKSVDWQKLQPADLRGGDLFGCSVAIAGDWAIVGASKANVSGKIQAGAAYIFQLYEGRWKLYQKIQAQEEPQAYAGFGCSVAIGDEIALVGADYADAPAGKKNAGAVYLFQFEKGEWEQKQVFQPQDLDRSDEWGKCVAYSENAAIAGIRGWPGKKNPGFAYITDVVVQK